MTLDTLADNAYLQALLTLPAMRNPAVSPDGRLVAWTWYRAHPTTEVYLAPTDGSTGPVRLTETAENTFLVSWTPDSRAVIVQQDEGGNERDQLFRVDVDAPLAMRPLTEARPNYFIRGGDLHPDGRRLVYGANVDLSTGREIEPTWVYCHDLTSGERRVLARPVKGGYNLPSLSPDGRHVLYQRKDLHPSGIQQWLVGIDGEGDREFLNFGPDVKTFAGWLPDSSGLLFLAETPTHWRLGIRPLDGGPVRWLIDDPARTLEDAYMPYRSDRIVVVEVSDARRRCRLLDPASGAEHPLPDVAGNLVPLAPAANGTWIGQYYSAQQPADLVRFHLDDVRPERFAALGRVWERTPLGAADLAPAREFRWHSADGLPIQGWLYLPGGEPRGLIVHVHGGPTWHSENAVNPQIQYFVRRGFAVLDPNYRGSTGFGLAFMNAIKEDGWGGREQADIRAGIEALLAEGIARPGRVGITGTSYGGYSAWWAITHFPPDILAAAAPICGMTDLVVDYETTRPDLRPYSEEMLGGRPDQVPERYHERSPINHVGNIRGRLLIVQGEQDPNVNPENVRAVRAALESARVPYELLTFPDEGHGIYRRENLETLYLRLVEFFEQSFDV